MYMRLRISESCEVAWRHWTTGWLLFAIFAIWCLWWTWHIPSIGYAIGALAVVASVMAALMENLKALARFAWIILLFGFLWVETKAIDEDKRKTSQELTQDFKNVSQQEQGNLQKLLDEEHKNLQNILSNQQADFSKMITQLLRQEREQGQEFNAVLTKQRQLFESQQEFSAFLSGKLLPSTDQMPSTRCTPRRSDDVVVFLGTNGFVTNKFPHTIVQVHGQRVIFLDRSGN